MQFPIIISNSFCDPVLIDIH